MVTDLQFHVSHIVPWRAHVDGCLLCVHLPALTTKASPSSYSDRRLLVHLIASPQSTLYWSKRETRCLWESQGDNKMNSKPCPQEKPLLQWGNSLSAGLLLLPVRSLPCARMPRVWQPPQRWPDIGASVTPLTTQTPQKQPFLHGSLFSFFLSGKHI